MTARLIALALLAATVGIAQTRPGGPSPSDLYHQGAKLFVDGEDQPALAAVEAGLAQAPGDARLQALRDLILQNQEENDQQDENQDQQDGDGQQNEDSQDGEQEPQDQDQDSSEDGEQDQRPPEAEQDGTAQQPPQNQGQGQGQPQDARQPDEMTAAQAQRLLDAVGGEERLLLREMQRSTGQRRRSDKDW